MTYSLGRIVQHDPRSLAFVAATAPLKTVTHRLSGQVLDQGNLGSCTGNAMAQALNTGGHEIAVVGINTHLERVTLLNSWGPSWGRNGRAYLKFADLDALLQAQGDVVVPVL